MKKVLLLDRDGVINKKATDDDYVKRWEEFSWIDENIHGLKLLAKKGFEFVVITNQAGVGRKKMTNTDLDVIHRNMISHLQQLGINILSVYACIHNRDEGCECRKPKPGHFKQAAIDVGFELSKTLYIGDDPKDCKAASAAGSQSIFLGDYQKVEHLAPQERPLEIVKCIPDAIPTIELYFSSI